MRASGARPRARAASGTPCSTPGKSPCLDYHGGPVLHSNTAYAIYWQPSGSPAGVSAFPAGYTSFIDTYFANVAAADGELNNDYSVATQYTDTTGSVGYGITTGAAIHDTDPLPTSGCVDTALPTSPCLTDSQIQTEIDHVIAINSLPRGAGPIYFLITPPGLASCAPNAGCYDNNGGFCAYHGDFNLGTGETIYANIGYADVNGCTTQDKPNNVPGDDAVNLISHEHIESMTDPEGTAFGTTPGWYDDGSGYEIADICAFDYGTALGNTSNGAYNELINGGTYELQTEWSNADNACIAGQPSPTVTLSSTPPVYPQQVATFTASSNQTVNYQWSFGDGTGAGPTSSSTQTHAYAASGTYTVTVTGTNPSTGRTSQGATRVVSVLASQPSPTFTMSPLSPTAGQPVGFDASASSDVGSSITSWSWDFGDGTATTGGPKITHVYSAAGPMVVTLTVRDGAGQSASVSRAISVQSTPPLPPVHTKALKAFVVSGTTLRNLLKKGLTVTISCDGSCTAAARLLLHSPASKARHSRTRTKLVDVGRVSGTADASGKLRLTLKLTSNGKKRLRHQRKPTLTVVVDSGITELTQAIHPR